MRRVAATGAAPPSRGDSPLFSYLNAGKRSVTTVSEELLARADIVIVASTRTAAIERGIDPWKLLENAPQSIVVSVSDFGWTGPWAERPATEFTLQAWSGLTGFRGDPAGPPISIGGGAGRVHGRCLRRVRSTGLRRRVRRGGPGGHLDLSMLEAITFMQSGEWLHSELLAVPPIKRSVEVPSIEPAKDGYVGISMVTGQQWLDFAAMVDCPEFTGIPICASNWDDGPTATGLGTGLGHGARAHRRRDRRTRSAVPAAYRPAGQRFDHPAVGPHA